MAAVRTPSATQVRSGRRLGACWLAFLGTLVVSLIVSQAAQAYVYWANSGTIGRSNLDGTGVNLNFVTGASVPAMMAVDGAHLYWANAGSSTIARSNLDGTGVNQNFITDASGVGTPVGVAVDGSYVYWANDNTNTIARANLDGTGVNINFITGANVPVGVTVDGAHVYWANVGPSTIGSIGRANLDGTGVNQNFITGAPGPQGVAVDAAHIYWVNFISDTIGRANLDGTGVDENFITAGSVPFGVAVDAAHIFWTSRSTNAIGRANLDGTGVNQNFITGLNDPNGVAVDGLSSPPQYALTVSAAGSGAGTVTDATGAIYCLPTCTHSYPAGGRVTLTATPAVGSVFAGFSGGCSGTGACNVTMSSAQTVTATFTRASAQTPKPQCLIIAKSYRVTVPNRHKTGRLYLLAQCDQTVNATIKGTIAEMVKHHKHVMTFTQHATLNAGAARTITVHFPAALVLALRHHVHESAAFSLTGTNTNGVGLARTKLSGLNL